MISELRRELLRRGESKLTQDFDGDVSINHNSHPHPNHSSQTWNSSATNNSPSHRGRQSRTSPKRGSPVGRGQSGNRTFSRSTYNNHATSTPSQAYNPTAPTQSPHTHHHTSTPPPPRTPASSQDTPSYQAMVALSRQTPQSQAGRSQIPVPSEFLVISSTLSDCFCVDDHFFD